MAKLKWDQTSEHYFETGVKNCVLYPYNKDNSTKPYSPGVAWNGISSISESPEGADENAIYADDTKYLSLRSVEEFGGTIEAYTYPDEWAKCDGSGVIAAGVMVGQQSRQMFGLCYRTSVGNDVDGSDHGYKLHLIYGATASPSERSYETINDSPEAITFSWEFKTVGVEIGHDLKNTSIITIDSTKLDSAGKTALKTLETYLYGTDSSGSGSNVVAATDPYLPLPSEIYTLFNPPASGSGT